MARGVGRGAVSVRIFHRLFFGRRLGHDGGMRLHSAFLIFFGVILNTIGCVYKETGPNSLQLKYYVWEIEVHSGYGNAGEKYRIAVIPGLEDESFGRQILFSGQALPRPQSELFGYDGLGYERAQVQPGVAKMTTSTRQQFASLFNFEPLEIKGIGGQPAKYSQTLIKSCDVKVHFDEVSELKNTGSGVIAIPKFVKKQVAEIATPACYAPEDRTFKLGAFAPKASEKSQADEIAKSIALSKKADEERDLEKRRYALAEVNTRKMNMKVGELVKAATFKAAAEISFENELRSRLCPEAAAMAQVLGVKQLKAERKEISSEKHEGYTSVRHETSLTFVFNDGHEDKYTNALGKEYIGDALKSLTPDSSGCFVVERRANSPYSDDDILSDIVPVIKSHLVRRIEDRGFYEALKVYPMAQKPE